MINCSDEVSKALLASLRRVIQAGVEDTSVEDAEACPLSPQAAGP